LPREEDLGVTSLANVEVSQTGRPEHRPPDAVLNGLSASVPAPVAASGMALGPWCASPDHLL